MARDFEVTEFEGGNGTGYWAEKGELAIGVEKGDEGWAVWGYVKKGEGGYNFIQVLEDGEGHTRIFKTSDEALEVGYYWWVERE